MFLDVSRTSLMYTDIFSRQIVSILKILNVDESHPHERQISTTYNTFSHIYTLSPCWWLQIPLFGVVTNVKGDLDETGRDLIVQRRGRR